MSVVNPLLAVFLGACALLVPAFRAAPPAYAESHCGFVLGFAALRASVGTAVVGGCLESERFNPANGNAEQRTTGGLLVWRKVDNWTAFTDGYRTWVSGPAGVELRRNTERFAWESDPLARPPFTLFFLNVGQGDAALLIAPDGTTAMIDAGDEPAGEPLLRFLADRGIDRIDWWLPSHPHADHVAGFTAVLEAGIPVGRALLSPQQHNTRTWLRQLTLLFARGVAVETAVAGRTFPLDSAGEVLVTVLNPPQVLARPTDVEDNSVVLLITHGSTTWLFTGDITRQGEAEIAARWLASGERLSPVDVLKVTHHGSASGSSAPFLTLVRPTRALIGVGEDNPFDHPTDAALERLAAAGAEVLRTDRHATIVPSSDGSDVAVELHPAISLVPRAGNSSTTEQDDLHSSAP